MTEDQKLFDSCFSHLGGFHSRENTISSFLNDLVKDSLWMIRQKNRFLKPPPKLIVDVINNNYFGAVALNPNGKDLGLIGVNSGTYYLIMDIFLRAFSYKNLFQDMGDSTLEINDQPTLRNFYYDVDKLYQFGDLDYLPYKLPIPRDPVRGNYARNLAMWSMAFIISHEFYHIMNGHVFLLVIRQKKIFLMGLLLIISP